MSTMEQREKPQRESRKEQETQRRRKAGSGLVHGARLGVVMSKLDFNRFAYRWINDRPGRMIAKTKEDDWDVVMNDGHKQDNDDLGNAVSHIVGTHADGKPLMAYLCRKPKSYFEEDQKARLQELDKQLAELQRGNDRSGASQGDYIPNEGISLRG